MNDGPLYTLVIATLNAGLAGYPEFGSVAVKQAYQPRTVGAPSGASLLLSSSNAKRYGYLRRANIWVPPNPPALGYMERTEAQMWIQTFQCNAQVMAPPQPDTVQDFTSGDLAAAASWILQGDDGRAALLAGGVFIDRVTDIRNPFFKNEQGQFQQSPSFDFTLSYEEVKTYRANILTSAIFRILGV